MRNQSHNAREKSGQIERSTYNILSDRFFLRPVETEGMYTAGFPIRVPQLLREREREHINEWM